MSIPNPFRPVCGTLGGELPPGFTRVNYIASTEGGGQYIDSGIVANASLIWMLDWAPLDTLYCSHGSYVGSGHVDINYGGSNGPHFRVTRSAIRNDRNTPDEVGTRLAVWCDLLNKRCKFGDDEEWRQMESNNIFSATHITLCGRSTQGEVSYLRSSRIYRSTMWLGETLVEDLAPALDRQGRPCLYNVAGTGSVEQNTFYNAGSGEFLYA